MEILDERVPAHILFQGNGKIQIKAFSHNGRVYRVSRVTLRTRVRVGGREMNVFCVESSDGNVFELVFDDKLLEWRLLRILNA